MRLTERGHTALDCTRAGTAGSLAHPNRRMFLLGVRLGRDVGTEHGALRALELDGAHLVGVRVRVGVRVGVGVGVRVGVRVRVKVEG